MKHDDKHWREHGFYESFEAYNGQTPAKVPYDPGIREAWIKEIIEERKTRKKAEQGKEKQKGAAPNASTAGNCRELISMMPLAFNPAAAEGLEAVYQFDVYGDEEFTAHLGIAGGGCTYQEGPADRPNLILKTPADVWLKISRGELDGQKAFLEGQYKAEGDMNLLLN